MPFGAPLGAPGTFGKERAARDMEIRFYDQALDRDLTAAVVAARAGEDWILCRRRGQEGWALPAAPRREGESIYDTALRALWEGAGVTDCQLEPVTAYGLFQEGEAQGFGGLFFAEIRTLEEGPKSPEVEALRRADRLPEELAEPELHPALMEQVQSWLAAGNFRAEEDDLMELLF